MINKNHTQFIWNMTWAYSKNSTHEQYFFYNNDQLKMYNAIIKCVKKCIITNKDIVKIIPNGTAIQNGRTSFVGDNWNRDGFHLRYDIGRYLAGLNAFKTLTNVDISKVKYFPEGIDIKIKDVIIKSIEKSQEKPLEISLII